MSTRIHVGLPYSSNGRLTREAQHLGCATLISVNSLWRRKRFHTPGRAAWATPAALDSAGFVAMRRGGYRWTVRDYVALVVTCGGNGAKPFPWLWWSAMDYCCEPEIAANRAEVERRISLTVESYAETLAEVDWWREEGDTDTPDPMPVLQGRLPGDYLRCAREFAEAGRGELPPLVGVGSVCRRHLSGPDGLLVLLHALDRELPKHVKLHLFGVKGPLMERLGLYLHRVASVDSMAWDFAARRAAKASKRSCTTELRAAHMREWYERQAAALDVATNPVQLGLFARCS